MPKIYASNLFQDKLFSPSQIAESTAVIKGVNPKITEIQPEGIN